MLVQLPLSNLYSQQASPKPTRQSSFEAFSQGNYEKAYMQFRELLVTYPKDPLYKYYSGVCLVKMGKEPGEAAILLYEAMQGGSGVKTLPSDGLFYLGRAQQMGGRFSEATETFDSYTKQVGKKAAKDLGVQEYLKECGMQKGKIPEAEAILLSETKKEVLPEPKVEIKPEVKPEVAKPINATSKPVNDNKPLSYEQILSQALEFQFKADSVTSVVSKQKKDLELLSGAEKLSLKLEANDNEKLAAVFQSSADQKYKEAQNMMGTRVNTMEKEQGTVLPTVKDTPPVVAEVKQPARQDTSPLPVRSPNPQVDIYSYFEVLDAPVTDPRAKVAIDPEAPAGLIYRIQLGVLRNPASPAYFKGIMPVFGFKVPDTDKIIYYAGMFRKYADASKALSVVRAKGFKDAFIVSLIENKKVSTDRAAQMEKEWGAKPFVSIETTSGIKADTVTQTLIFRVEVMRTSIPATEDVVEPIKRLVGERGLDVLQRSDGKISYLVGKFITFETAEDYANLLQRNGYKDTQVVSWLGKKEIPVESAKKLFDELK